MNLKEFLKPDWRKIVITLVFFFCYSYLFFSSLYFTPPLETYREPSELENILFKLLGFPTFVASIFVKGGFGIDQTYMILSFFVTIFYWYLLSCLVVWVCNKVKKK